MRHTMVTYTVKPGREEENALASFHAFAAGAQDRHEQPATFTQPDLIGDYRTFDNPDRSASASDPAPAPVSAVGESGGAKTDVGAGLFGAAVVLRSRSSAPSSTRTARFTSSTAQARDRRSC